jgi:carboxymethylenebutenolidase
LSAHTRARITSTTLKDTIATANLPAEIEVYAGVRRARPVSAGLGRPHEPQAEKAWSRVLALYDKALA